MLPGRIGNYEVVSQLARGGMANVYLARRDHVDPRARYVALKVLDTASTDDPAAGAMFDDEARVLALLDHDNLTRVHDAGAHEQWRYLALDYVHGVDLRTLLQQAMRARRPIPRDVTVAIVMAVCAGLDHAHRRCSADGRPLHLVHRDVSPSNVMVQYDGGVKVIDFGIAQAAVSEHQSLPGIVRGKASYMSPEQCVGDAVDRRSDVFALGVLLYELTTGRPCFPGKSDVERMTAVIRSDVQLPRDLDASYPEALEDVVLTALAPSPTNRFASAAAMREALAGVTQTQGWFAGAHDIAGLLRVLFGEVLSPWDIDAAIGTTVDATEPLDLRSLPEPIGADEIEKPRRFPRSTQLDAAIPDDPDDMPTRGRRSQQRLFGRAIAAPATVRARKAA